jgi:hypothetical protein
MKKLLTTLLAFTVLIAAAQEKDQVQDMRSAFIGSSDNNDMYFKMMGAERSLKGLGLKRYRATNQVRNFSRFSYADVTGRTSTASSLSSISAVTTSDGTDLTAQVSLLTKHKEGSFSPVANIINLAVTTPFSGKKKEAINLDGLGSKTSVSVGLYWELWGSERAVYVADHLDEAKLVKVLNGIGAERECDCCEKPDTHPTYSDLSNAEKLLFQQRFEYKMWVPFLGLRGKLARGDYDYFTDTFFTATASDTKYDYELRGFAGMRITNHKSAALTAVCQNYWNAGDAENFNVPLKAGVEQQQELYMSAPVHKTKMLVQLEYRTINNKATFGFNPYLLTDMTNQQLEGKLQFYFFRNKDDDGNFKGLNGGVFLGYRTGKNFVFDWTKSNVLVGLFFSGVFDVNKY